MAVFDTLLLISDSRPSAGPCHMAHDELLLERAERGGSPILRSYAWASPATTFGYFQSLDSVQPLTGDRPTTRRSTGGGFVEHGDGEEFTYSLIVPSSHPFARLPARESYVVLHAAVVGALHASAVAATLIDDQARSTGSACFQHPVRGDVVCPESRQKLAGAAQRRHRHGLLIQGSIRLAKAVPESLLEHLSEKLGALISDSPPVPIEEIEVLAAAKYGTRAWLERRP